MVDRCQANCSHLVNGLGVDEVHRSQGRSLPAWSCLSSQPPDCVVLQYRKRLPQEIAVDVEWLVDGGENSDEVLAKKHLLRP